MTAPDVTVKDRIAERDRLRALSGPELAVEVVALIDDNLNRWYQDSWRHNGEPHEKYEEFREDPLNPSCRTSFCHAGWVAAIDGVRWFDGSNDLIGHPDHCTCTGKYCTVTSHVIHVSDYARTRLGLDETEAARLFNGDNTFSDLEAMTAAMAAGQTVFDVRLDRDYYDDYGNKDYEDEEESDDDD